MRSGLCPRDPLQQRRAQGDRRLLADATSAASRSFHPFFPEGRWCASTSSSRCRRASAEIRSRDARARGRGDRAHLDRRARRRSRRAQIRQRRDAARALPTPSPTDSARSIRRPAVGDIRIIEGSPGSRPLGVDFHRRPGMPATASA
jgi:hypothetical protein